MNDMTEQRLARLEQKLDYDFNQTQNDEIDLRELWNVIWAGRIKIIAITAVFAIASVIYALSLPNMYKSEIILAPAQSEGGGGLAGLAAQYGGLAAMAGINLGGGESSDIDQAMELIKSWSYLDDFITRHKIKPQIMAVKKWNKQENKLQYDTDLYDPETAKWAMDGEETAEPTSYKTYKVLSKLITTSLDSKSGLLNISVEHYSPYIAKQWAEWLAQDINQHFQNRDIAKATKNINYLTRKIAETSISEMQSVFYSMIESQTKTLMLAEVGDEYLVQTVVPAKVAEEKSKPKRALIVIIFILLGGLIGTVYILLTNAKRK